MSAYKSYSPAGVPELEPEIEVSQKMIDAGVAVFYPKSNWEENEPEEAVVRIYRAMAKCEAGEIK